MNIRIACVSAAIAFATALPAQAQGPGGPGGPPPNYQQLVAAITNLQNRVAKLEGNIVASDLAGNYALVGLDTSMTAFHPGAPPVPATITTAGFRGSLTLNADGTGHTFPLACEATTLTQGSWALSGTDCSEAGSDVTWTYADGVITITFLSDGDEIPFYVGLGGRLLMMVAAPFHPSDPSSDQFLFLATRLK